MHDLLPAAAVTYVGLPISSGGGHSLGRMSRRAAYDRTVGFLETCTELVGRPSSSIAVQTVPELAPQPRLEEAVGKLFGPSGDVGPSRVGEALDFLDEIDPQPTNRYGMAPVWFFMKARFRLLDPATERPIPGQDPDRFRGAEYVWSVPLGSSDLQLSLHDHAVLAVDLCIPDATEELLQRVIPWLQRNLPFKLSPSQWRAWRRAGTGSFTSRKLRVTFADAG
jgi:hypothetical protein